MVFSGRMFLERVFPQKKRSKAAVIEQCFASLTPSYTLFTRLFSKQILNLSILLKMQFSLDDDFETMVKFQFPL